MNREAITLSAAFFASLVPGDPAKSFTLPWILPANAALLGYQMKGTFLFPNAGEYMGLQLVTAGPTPQTPLAFTNGNGALATSGLFLSTRSQKSIIISAFGSPPNGGSVVLDLIWAPLTTSSVGALGHCYLLESAVGWPHERIRDDHVAHVRHPARGDRDRQLEVAGPA